MKPSPPTPDTPRFDAGAAWNSAVAIIKANRELMIVVAGLFFLLPQLVMAFLIPEPPAGLEGDAEAEAILSIVSSWWPVWLIGLIAIGMGMLAVIVLITGRDRPTVGEALQRGLKALPSLIAAQLVVVAGVGLGMLLIMVPFSLGGEVLAGVGLIGALIFAAWIYARTLLIAPVLAGENIRNPFEAIMKSWQMSRGNAGRLLGFFLLLLLANTVIYLVATSIPAAIAIVLGGQLAGKIVSAVMGSLIAAIFSLISTAVLTAAWAQLRAKR